MYKQYWLDTSFSQKYYEPNDNSSNTKLDFNNSDYLKMKILEDISDCDIFHAPINIHYINHIFQVQ